MKNVPFALIALLAAAPVLAESMPEHGMAGHDHATMHGASAEAVAVADGTVNGIDAERGLVNLSHGPIPAFNWPPMKMSLKVADAKLLEQVKPGDKVKFRLQKLSAVEYVIVGFDQVADEHAQH